MSRYKLLEYFHFTRNASESNKERFLENIKTRTLFKETFNPPTKFLQIVEELKTAIIAFGHDLGFDLSKRVKHLDGLVFVAQEELEKIAPGYGAMAYFRPDVNFKIYVSVIDKNGFGRDQHSIVRLLNHEFLHGISYQEVRLQGEDGSFRITRSGLDKIDKFFLLDESLCELSNLYIINKFWSDFAHLRPIVPLKGISYLNGVSLLNGLIERLSKKSHLRYMETLRLAQTDMLTGSDRFLDLCKKRIGENVVNELSELSVPRKYDKKFLLGLANKYQLKNLRTRLEKDISKEGFSDFELLLKIGQSV